MSLARFGVRNPVPVNLLMIAILLAGGFSAMSMRREFFPEIDPEAALITLPYPGATPEEIEETLARKVEDALIDLDEIKELRSTLTESGGGITAEFHEQIDVDKAMDEIDRSIDSLRDLPEESETIQVQLFEPRLPVIRVALFGDMDEEVQKRAIRGVRDDLRSLPGMGEILVDGVRDYELRIDVRHEALLQHGISLPQVAEKIGDWMKDVPGGTVRNHTGNVRVRTMGVEEKAQAVREIPLQSDAQGRILKVKDVAEVRNDFVDEQLYYRHNGKPAVGLTVFKVGNQDIVTMAEMVRSYVQARNGETFEPNGVAERLALSSLLPQGIRDKINIPRLEAWHLGNNSTRPLPHNASIDVSSDLARFVEGRLDLLTRNAKYGAVLVFATLLLVLNWRVAMWVGVGLVTALMGTLVLMNTLDVTLNLLTMFGLIVVLGLLVDDAIVVSENIQSRHDEGEPAAVAAEQGVTDVFWPVVATVMTTVVAFLPLTFIKGRIGDLLGALPLVVACALTMSLIESLLILPNHMAHSLAKRDRSRPGKLVNLVRQAEQWRDRMILQGLVPLYGRVIRRLLTYRYVSVSVALATLIVSLALVISGHVPFTFLNTSDSETIIVDVRLPVGSPIQATDTVVKRIEAVADAQPETMSIASIIGQRSNIDTGANEAFAPHIAQMFIEIKPVEKREELGQRESGKVIDGIREALKGKLPEVDRLTFSEIQGGPGGEDISFQIRGKDMTEVMCVVDEMKQSLASFKGVNEIADDNDLGQLEIQFSLKPGAPEGFTTADVARQVRGFLYGLDAHVYAADEEDIDVRVRLDKHSRQSLYAIENSWLIGPTGKAVPFSEIAEKVETTTYATIRRVDRQRAVTVSASTSPDVSPETIVPNLPLDELRQKYPSVQINLAGRQEQLQDAFASLPLGFAAAMIMIYVILAWLFSSFTQPLIVLIVVPFSIIGVVWGHLLLGYQLTFLSLIGFVALSGIVVNDSLILVKFYNGQRDEGKDVFNALVAAGMARLRPILLTTITTVLGLTPLMLERSFQAKFLIPMAISIAMGLVAATTLVLIVLPCFIQVFDDLHAGAYFLWFGERRPPKGAVSPIEH